ncbi:MAG: MDR family MFS transporter [Rhodospirillales bacterium]
MARKPKKSTKSTESKDPSKALTPREQRAIIFGLLLSMLLAALDQTIVAPALPTIGLALNDLGQLSWVVTVYLLAATAVTPLYGKLADIHGRRVMLNGAIVVFVIGSVLCALSPTVLLLSISRAVQGLGGGGLIALAQTTIGDAVAPRERARYQGLIASVFASASVAGPLLGGFFAEHLHWSYIFWINIPLGAVAMLVMNRALKDLPQNHHKHRLDLLGAALMLIGTLSLLFALTWGGVRFAWASPPILALLACFAVFAALFIWRLRRAAEPLLPLDVLRDKVVLHGIAAASFGMGGFVGLVVHVPLYLEQVVGLSASQAGLALIALMIGTPIGATISGRAMLKLNHYKLFALIGVPTSTAGLMALGLFGAGMPLWAIEIALALIGMGIGTMFPVTTVAVQNAVDRRHLGVVTGMLNFNRQLLSALMVAAFGTIMLSVAGPAVVGGELGSTAVTLPNVADMARGYRFVFLAAAGSMAIGLINLIFMEERPLRSSATPQTAVEI